MNPLIPLAAPFNNPALLSAATTTSTMEADGPGRGSITSPVYGLHQSCDKRTMNNISSCSPDAEDVKPEIRINIGGESDGHGSLKSSEDAPNNNNNPSGVAPPPVPPPDRPGNLNRRTDTNNNTAGRVIQNGDEADQNGNQSSSYREERRVRINLPPPSRPNRRTRRINLEEYRLVPQSGPFLCCQDIQFAMQLMAFFDIFVASACGTVFGGKYLATNGGECSYNGLICSMLLLPFPLVLLCGSRRKNMYLCFFYLVISWIFCIYGVILAFTMDCWAGKEKEVAMSMIAAIELGLIYKVYETNVVWHFITKLVRERQRRRELLVQVQVTEQDS